MVNSDKVTIRSLITQADYDACVRLQREVWGSNFTSIVPPAILHVTQEVGGVSAGAFDNNTGQLLGFVFGISGIRDGKLAHWSDMLAVRQSARNAGIGKRLKFYQRDYLIAHGIRRMFWSFDPLVASTANFNLNVLGSVPVRYIANMYGNTHSILHKGLDTDRFIVEWRLDTAIPRANLFLATVPHDMPTVDLDRTSNNDPFPDAPWVRISVPVEIELIKTTNPNIARNWQLLHRRAFSWYFSHGYRVSDFVKKSEPTTSHYLLTNLPVSSSSEERITN